MLDGVKIDLILCWVGVYFLVLIIVNDKLIGKSCLFLFVGMLKCLFVVDWFSRIVKGFL